MTPSVRVDYTRIESESYHEQGALNPDLNLAVDSNQLDQLIVGVDGRLDYELNQQVSISLNMGVGYNLMHQVARVSASFSADPATEFLTDGVNPSVWTGRAGLGLDWRLTDSSNLTLRYATGLSEDLSTHAASLNFRLLY